MGRQMEASPDGAVKRQMRIAPGRAGESAKYDLPGDVAARWAPDELDARCARWLCRQVGRIMGALFDL